jgi:SAM-dependent methyltransferase
MAWFWWLRRRVKTKQPPQAWVRAPQAATPMAAQRRYLEEAEYLLPKDQEEQARLDFQHHALNLTLGNHYLAPLPPQIRTIVDVGTGTGIWSIELARIFPESLVLGLDVDAALLSKTPPANCLLRVGNVLAGLPLPDQFADFVHQRFLVLAIPDVSWPLVVHELVRVTRVGGWLELVETDAHVLAGGLATAQVFAWIDVVRAARGLEGRPVQALGVMLQREGLQEIEIQRIELKVGVWDGRAGIMMERDILAAVQALKEPCCAQGVDSAKFDQTVRAMAAEWQQAQAYCVIYVAYGRRIA